MLRAELIAAKGKIEPGPAAVKLHLLQADGVLKELKSTTESFSVAKRDAKGRVAEKCRWQIDTWIVSFRSDAETEKQELRDELAEELVCANTEEASPRTLLRS